jgi:hypothetical protein
MLETLKFAVPVLLTFTSRGAGSLPMVTVPKSKLAGKTCAPGLVVEPSPPPPPPPHPNRAAESIRAIANRSFDKFLTLMEAFLFIDL